MKQQLFDKKLELFTEIFYTSVYYFLSKPGLKRKLVFKVKNEKSCSTIAVSKTYIKQTLNELLLYSFFII